MKKVHLICCGSVNCFLISDGGSAVLVDTGREKYREKVLHYCKEYRVRLLVLTHGHVDHIQNAAFLSKELGVPIGMHRADVELIQNNMLQPLQGHGPLGHILLRNSKTSMEREQITPFLPDIFLEDGDTLEKYGVAAKVIGLPGHTKGSIGLDVAGQEVIVGDALMNLFYPMVSALFCDEASLMESARKISALGERRVYFGHGLPADNRQWSK